jgi:hypothetical protein
MTPVPQADVSTSPTPLPVTMARTAMASTPAEMASVPYMQEPPAKAILSAMNNLMHAWGVNLILIVQNR